MRQEELVRYSFMVVGKAYPVRVKMSEMEDLKKIEKLINSKILDCMAKYKNLGKIDILTLGFLEAISEIKDSTSRIDQEALLHRLENLEGILDTAR